MPKPSSASKTQDNGVGSDEIVIEGDANNENSASSTQPNSSIEGRKNGYKGSFNKDVIEAEYVIIGAGLSGLSAAWEILRLRGIKPSQTKGKPRRASISGNVPGARKTQTTRNRRGSLTDVGDLKPVVPTVVVVDANDRMGGRLCSVATENGPAVDVGGMWVGAKHEAIKHFLTAELGLEKELLSQRHVGNKVFDYKGEKHTYGGLLPWSVPSFCGLLQTVYAQMWLRCYRAKASIWNPWRVHKSLKKGGAMSILEFLKAKLALPCASKDEENGSLHFVRTLLNIMTQVTFGADMKDVSASHFLGYSRASDQIENMGDFGPGTLQEKYLRNGAGEICSKMAEQLRQHGVVFKTQSQVTDIMQNVEDNEVTVTVSPSNAVSSEPITRYYRPESADPEKGTTSCELEETYAVRTGTTSFHKDSKFKQVKSKRVILAIPPASYKHIQFSPELPAEKVALLSAAKMGNLTKTLFCFDRIKGNEKPFWVTSRFSGEVNSDCAPLDDEQIQEVLKDVPAGAQKNRLAAAAVYASEDIGCFPVSTCVDVSQVYSAESGANKYSASTARPDGAASSSSASEKFRLPCIGCFTGGSVADKWQNAPVEKRRDAATFQLVRWFGPQAAFPREVLDCNWKQHPILKGGPVAYYESIDSNKDSESATKVVLSDPHMLVHFAGTEMAGISQGFMDGAVRAGIRAAQEVSPEENLQRLPSQYNFSFFPDEDNFILWPEICTFISCFLLVAVVVLVVVFTAV
eukprot:gb/GECG01005399.1/.p1 GENE.gb/GECG01005399.1/~~gb/GECG01005399.1/.p1  ORF type:complete len:746 (+),score=100.59 gb/GECG01005399.1/:1-2238(+)